MPEEAVISSPTGGEALQGSVTISGTTAVEGFDYAELSFGYADDPTGTWFLIAEMGDPVEEDVLAQWDTTTITDGVYTLRLVVEREGDPLTATVTGLRVRNYTSLETETPTAARTAYPGAQTNTPPPPPTSLPPPPTALPTNPAQISAAGIIKNIGYGALAVVAAFLCIAGYTSLRKRK